MERYSVVERVSCALTAVLIVSAFLYPFLGGFKHKEHAQSTDAELTTRLIIEVEEYSHQLKFETEHQIKTLPSAQLPRTASAPKISVRPNVVSVDDNQLHATKNVQLSDSTTPLDNEIAEIKPLDLSEKVMRSAFNASKEDEKSRQPNKQMPEKLSQSKQEKFDAAITQAEIPSCAKPDALTHDRAHLGPVALSGLFATPFLLHAAIAGKCRF